MNAITKNRQTNDIIYQMAEKAFGEDKIDYEKEIVELDGGYCNVVYLVPLLEEDAILKIAPSDEIQMMSYEERILETEVAVMDLIERYTKVPSPKVLFFDDSKTICNSSYFFMTKSEGISYDHLKQELSKEQNEAIIKELGSYNKQINQIKGNYFGLIGKSSSRFETCREFILSLFQMLIKDGKRKGSNLVHITYEELWELITSYAEVFDEVMTPRLVHWDLWDGNIFVQNGSISGIIDYERGFYGDFLMENEFSSFSEPSKGFLEAYGKEEFTPKEMIRCTIYRLYRCIVMIVECDYRKYDNDKQYNWMIDTLKVELEKLKKLSQ
ncbi:phosphotransferase family protein [Lachnoclostridium phytofermentans]|uniref:Protein kinase domain-containing protein n=1 Tax=Lachnoclostridium phytofermentans (strain ATCC 700394 / DSM 18823 / ISDg) TaxID=357809 RepID=A9KRE0_LACP7|nr:aminoglycoside phosphotransferase family protein [Lachnoclostridium phytofermentans]ABX42014.1 hypothetical protein Cphy_1642 [Lachnoclostridium phytofermentans ISDg]